MMKIAVAQINPLVGDLLGNSQKILALSQKAHEIGAQLVVFPELSLTGYPPKDLLLRNDFLDEQRVVLTDLARKTLIPIIVGAAIKEISEHAPYNAAVLCEQGQWRVIHKKLLLPNYNVFDEQRYFRAPADKICSILTFKGKKILISICEDAWSTVLIDGLKMHDFDPIDTAFKEQGALDLIINMSASPFSIAKPKMRQDIFVSLAKTYETPVLLSGQVGANDQLLFDGHSMIIDRAGHIKARAKPCDEDLLLYDSDEPLTPLDQAPLLDDDDLLMDMLTLGIRDYVEKCRMKGVIIGVSGGIDSAVCLALAVRALGKERVRAVFLPSRFTSDESLIYAHELTHNLGLELEILPIEDTVLALRKLLAKDKTLASPLHADIFDQNLQSRIRGLIIMGLTNIYDHLMIATSNKSELAMGYSTLYGDMCGALSAIGDLYKTEVWKLSHTINSHKNIIPNPIINRAPTAELKADQLDTDTLPEFHILDDILFNFIDLEKSPSEIEAITGSPRALIDDVIKKVNLAEYKRRQAPFCLMVSNKVFGDARRLPIAKRV